MNQSNQGRHRLFVIHCLDQVLLLVFRQKSDLKLYEKEPDTHFIIREHSTLRFSYRDIMVIFSIDTF